MVVLQGRILEPLLFNIHIRDLFFQTDNLDIASYANDIPYVCCDSIGEVIQNLQDISKLIVKMFFRCNI